MSTENVLDNATDIAEPEILRDLLADPRWGFVIDCRQVPIGRGLEVAKMLAGFTTKLLAFSFKENQILPNPEVLAEFASLGVHPMVTTNIDGNFSDERTAEIIKRYMIWGARHVVIRAAAGKGVFNAAVKAISDPATLVADLRMQDAKDDKYHQLLARSYISEVSKGGCRNMICSQLCLDAFNRDEFPGIRFFTPIIQSLSEPLYTPKVYALAQRACPMFGNGIVLASRPDEALADVLGELLDLSVMQPAPRCN